MAQHQRSDRVAAAVREEVANFLAEGVKDPRVTALVTVTGVEMTRDLRHAKVFVSIMGEDSQRASTIEGLASADGTLSPVQQGVVDEQGFQCAFCMPGFVMAATGYLKTNPNPTRQELAHGVSGNLCRCQDYDKILTALMRGAEHMRNA